MDDLSLEEITALYLLDSSASTSDLFYEAMINFSERDLNEEGSFVRRNRDGSVRSVNREDYSRSAKRVKTNNPWNEVSWLILIRKPDISTPTSRNGKDFRRMFRTPFPVFEFIVNECRATNEPAFNYEQNIKAGQVAIPLELKILFVLRVLGSGLLMRDGAELTNNFISNTEGTSFFKMFCKLFRKHFGPKYIKPLTDDALLRSMREYLMIGLAGCVGSVDGVFIPWDAIPFEDGNLCKGDKGKGLLFEVIVTHCKRCISIEGSYYSTINDAGSVKYSKFLSDLKEKKIYKDLSYRIKIGPNENDFVELSSVYVIADGGYLEWSVIISGFGVSNNPIQYKFTDWIASVRKDVECFFGILKKRFRFLKCPISLRNQEDIDNAFWTCCIIHNMILESDGLDRLWEDGVNWDTLNPVVDDNDSDNESNDSANNNNDNEVMYTVTQHNPDTFRPIYADALIPIEASHSYDMDGETDEKEKHNNLKNLLANHLQYMYREGMLRWPRYRKDTQSQENNIVVNERVRNEFQGAGDLDF